MDSLCPYLFVYGTLRRQSAHQMARFLETQGRCLGQAVVQGQLYNLGRYPGLVQSSDTGDQVVGDVYELSQPNRTLAELDQYEGEQYERQLAVVIVGAGRTLSAWVYWYRGRVDECRRIAGGDYFG